MTKEEQECVPTKRRRSDLLREARSGKFRLVRLLKYGKRRLDIVNIVRVSGRETNLLMKRQDAAEFSLALNRALDARFNRKGVMA